LPGRKKEGEGSVVRCSSKRFFVFVKKKQWGGKAGWGPHRKTGAETSRNTGKRKMPPGGERSKKETGNLIPQWEEGGRQSISKEESSPRAKQIQGENSFQKERVGGKGGKRFNDGFR